MSSLIACPGCNHKLTLPDDFAGQRVQCPMCRLEFAALATAIPPMEVEPPAPRVEPTPGGPVPKAFDPPLPMETGYAPAGKPAGRSSAAASPSIFCSECGVKYPRTEDACPACGCPIEGYADEPEPERRRPRRRGLPPIREWLSLVAVILIPIGVAIPSAILFVGIEIFRLRGPKEDAVIFLGLVVGTLIESAALLCMIIWLYQAWRLVLHDDEEYSPGLMVGLLFVPVFNLYWMFRAIPGLSQALQQELRYMAPHRTHGAGWVPGLIACILMLIPYLQPFAVCMFLAWMLLANNALHRLARYHQRLQEDTRPDAPEGSDYQEKWTPK